MSDLFKSAFGYFSNNTTNTVENDFVGQIVEIGSVQLRIKKTIAEGGFAFVFVAQALDSGKEYALKRLLAADEEARQIIIQEINILKKLSGHPNIIQFVAATSVDKSLTGHGMGEFLLLTELCTGGSLVNVLQRLNGRGLPPDVVTKIMWQCCKAVHHMHSQSPPVIHRDLKVENLLIGGDNKIRLCDFGSATSQVFRPDNSWSSQQRSMLEDKQNVVKWVGARILAWGQECRLPISILHATEVLPGLSYSALRRHLPDEKPKTLNVTHYFMRFVQNIIEGGLTYLRGAKLIFKCTTPMYRAPEMVDTWANNEIGVASDLWALGCLTYLLCFNKHPFEDSSNLRIINANYSIPQADSRYKGFHGIINGCLNVQPNARLTIAQVLDRLAALSETLGINPAESIDFARLVPSNPIPVPTGNSNVSPVHQVHSTPPSGNSRSQSPAQRPPGFTQPAPPVPAPSGGGGLFSSIKGGAGSFLKNLKDTSTKVVQSVSQTMVRSEEMAASYITSRICVVNYTEGPDTLQDLRFTIESRHTLPNSAIYNLSSAPLPTHRFPNATIVECGWGKKCPSLQALYTLCEHMHHFLSSQPSNVLFIVCNDGKKSSPLLIAGFLLFVGFMTRPNDALQLYAVKRTPHNLQPSHIRYLEYFTQVLENPLPTLSCNKIRIMNIIMEPVPLFNKNRDGCRPYVDIFQGEDKVFTTIDEYDRMITFNISHGKVVLPVRCSVAGDITIVVNHARQVLTRITPIPVLRLQFNSAFTHDPVMMLSRGDLDDIEPEHFHDRFLVTINAEEAGDPFVTISPWAKHRPLSSSVLFSSKQEADEITESFVPKGKPPIQRPPPPRPVPPRPPPVSQPHPLQENSTRTEAADLLNLGFNSETSASNIPPSKPSAVETEDLLNLSFDSAPATVPVFNNNPDPGLAFPSDTSFFSDTSAPTSNDNGPKQTANLLGDWDADSSNFVDFSSSSVTSNFHTLNIDGGAGLNPTPSSQVPPQSNQFLSGFPNAGNIQRNVSSPNLQSDLFEELVTKPKAVSNANSPSKTPAEANYSRSHFEAAKPPPTVNPSKKMEDAFGDLLGSQGYSFTAKKDTGPRTINEMRREDQAKVTDPDKLKVMDWAEGKKSNIRALLTSLHTVLWPESKWNQCHMHQLVNPGEVKKAYRRACIAVHPDKHMGTPNEKLAKMIFMELNNAWNDFEKELG